jgi:1-acyl-sn-glycerol-3-phosphate acyltransferase
MSTPTEPAAEPRLAKRPPRDSYAGRSWLSKAWYVFTSNKYWVLFKLFYRLRITGAEQVPKTGPLVVVANHTSYLDPPLLGAVSPRQLSFLARDTLFRGPLGWYIASLDAIPIDRDGVGLAGLRATLGRLKHNGAVVVFPEGTRSDDGQLQPLKPGFLVLVRRGKANIQPIGMVGVLKALPRGRIFPRLARVRVHFGEPITVEQAAELDDDALLALVVERMQAALTAAERV